MPEPINGSHCQSVRQKQQVGLGLYRKPNYTQVME